MANALERLIHAAQSVADSAGTGDFVDRERATILRKAIQDVEDGKPNAPEWCAKCPFAKHVHYEEDGKLVAPGCIGFEAMTKPEG